tara:strand:+ start:330 stop:881 length:552 start_codon:yes stop_codon:yes gene_type:complete
MIGVNSFVKRQTEESRFSHFDGTWEELRELVSQNWERSKPGYRTGVILISVPPSRFCSSVVSLKEGDRLVGEYVPRRPGEAPRKVLGTGSRMKSPAKSVDIVLYSSKTLKENDDNELPAKEGNWEIISINASPTVGDTPIHPMVLMHNHFGSSGGTQTHLNDADFVNMMRESFHYWRDKATCS